MKKILGITLLTLAMGTSLIAGTMAVYNVELGTIAEGSVSAKAFNITGEGNEEFATDVKIAPTETITKTFTVSNHNGSIVSETPMKSTITIDLAASGTKQAIPYLTATVYKVTDSKKIPVGATITGGTGTMTFEDGYNLSASGETYTYEIKIEWSGENKISDQNANGISDDAEYAGTTYGNTVTVNVTGTQVNDATSYIK